jgi:hypothetical protein
MCPRRRHGSVLRMLRGNAPSNGSVYHYTLILREEHLLYMDVSGIHDTGI